MIKMKCPICGEEIEDGDVDIWTITEKQIKVWHIQCEGKWIYIRRKVKKK